MSLISLMDDAVKATEVGSPAACAVPPPPQLDSSRAAESSSPPPAPPPSSAPAGYSSGRVLFVQGSMFGGGDEDEEEEEEEEDKPMGHTVVADMEHDEHEGIDEASLKEHEEVTKVKNVRTIELGRHVMECWYFSPFPKEYYPNGFVDRLYFCEFSLRYFAHKSELARYQARGVDRHPPGNEIYRKDGLSMFEVDGAENKEYCESLCYMAKLFLDHKTLYYEVDPFLFYVMCEYDERGFHPTGYFSKEKYSDVGYNLACKNWQPFNFYLQIGSDVGYNLSIFTFALPKQVSSPSPATSARATGAFSSPSRTSCQKKSPKWGPQRSPCRTWARSGTEAIGRQRCSWSSRSTRARPSA
mmetsp:Transcript_32400/g.73222  ORF Transcript_32400/g.73222 Transcript_32400/m.73222 type:complete len:356 (-) Transcript_32400:586-1653(-)